MGTKRVRMFLIAGPRQLGAFTWADVSYQYLIALRVSGIKPRAIPIGGLQLPERAKQDRAWSHWLQVADAFQGDLGAVSVNVVCIPLGVPLGKSVMASEFVVPDRLAKIAVPEVKEPGETVYEPSTAISGLYTDGMVNIALTGCLGVGVTASYVDEDLRFLLDHPKAYSLILCPQMADVTWLGERGIEAQWCPPPRFAVDACKMPCFADVLDA
ncbi:MAG: hypothetical protein ABH877_04360 [bacterium]